jgi:hypothetical protein
VDNRGVFSGKSTSSGSIGSMNNLFTDTVSQALATKFHSSLPQGTIGPGYASYGGFLDTEQYAASNPAQRLAFLVDSMKSAGITAVIVQLL